MGHRTRTTAPFWFDSLNDTQPMATSALPLVSIIIPCYNASELAGDAIRSAIHQTYDRIEVIAVDDGSTDDTLDVIQSFGSRIRSLTGANRGGGAARNGGLEIATGEFVQFLDADDLLQPDCTARKIEAMQENGRFCYCSDWWRESEDGEVTSEQPSVSGADSVIAVLSGQIPTPSPLHRSADLRRVGGFDSALPCSQERDLHLRLACAGVRFARIAHPLCLIRRRRGSVSHDYTRVLLQHRRIYMRALQQLKETETLTESRRRALARELARDARRLYHRGRFTDAKQLWVASKDLDRHGAMGAYGRSWTRWLSRLIGPAMTEALVYAGRKALYNDGSHR